MNIVLALHQFPPFGGGGTELLARWIADSFRADGHAVHIVSAIPRRAKFDVPVPPDNGVRFLPLSPAAATEAERIRCEYDDAAAGSAFAAVLDELRPDIVHFLHLAGLTASAVEAARSRRIPCLFTATDFWFECPTIQLLLPDYSRCAGPDPRRLNCARHLLEIRHPSLQRLSKFSTLDGVTATALQMASRKETLQRFTAAFDALASRSHTLRRTLAQIDAIIAPTTQMRQRLHNFGIDEERLHLVGYGVPLPGDRRHATGRIASDPLRIAFIGTLAAHKGPHLLVQALTQLRDVALRLDLYGDMADTDYCRELQSGARADDRIRVCGRFADDAIERIFANIDVLVVPSLWDENAPLVLLQAIACRCPVLVSDVPGLLESLREGHDGWIFRRNDVDELVRSLRRLAADPDAITRIRSTPATPRSADDHVADLMRLYERVLVKQPAKA